MMKGKKKFRMVGILVAALVISTYCIGSRVLAKSSDDGSKARADMITINTLKVFGYLEKPEVVFLHDAHTDAMEKKGKDCSVCHLPRSTTIPGSVREAVEGIDPLSPKFKRLEDTARRDVMDVYHKFCIDCHTEMNAEGEKSGPLSCGECHQAKTEISSSRQLIGMDKNLHFRHSKSQEKKCEKCHHEYNAKEQKLIYVKEKEGTCRYCHLNEGQEIPPYAKDSDQISRLTMRQASHLDCIDCHRRTLSKKLDAGPVKCAGCHSAESQQKFKKAEKTDRMERKQPDAALVSTGEIEPEGGKLPNARMNRVAFDHKAHEEYNDNCRACHHASMDKCSKCHTMTGRKDGGDVKLEKAFHQISSEKSCTGCHVMKQSDPKCAGCHVFMEKGRKQDDAYCLTCHQEMTSDMIGTAKSGDEKALAEMMLRNREFVTGTYSDEDIPEKVMIKTLADKYEAVELPHRKIVKKLTEGMDKNKMASFFHREQGVMCQGCHHNSPMAKKPPRCESCHGKPFDEAHMMRPGLLGAYHQQCMTCHKEMKLEKPAGCTGCHKEKS